MEVHGGFMYRKDGGAVIKGVKSEIVGFNI
jgi:hypothetical protein